MSITCLRRVSTLVVSLLGLWSIPALAKDTVWTPDLILAEQGFLSFGSLEDTPQLLSQSSQQQADAIRLSEEAYGLYRRSQWLEAIERLQAALVIYREIGDRTGEALIFNNLGIVNQSLGDYSQALEDYQQSLVIIRELAEVHGTSEALRNDETRTLNNIGTVFRLLEDYVQALEYHEQSLVIARESGNRASEAANLSNIGTVNRLLGNYTQALEYYQRSLVIKREIGDRASIANLLHSIGFVNQLLGNYSQALDHYEQSLIIKREIGDRASEAETLNNVGEVNRLLGNYAQALEYYQKSLAINREIGNPAGETTLNNLGIINQLLGNYIHALEYYQQSLAIAREIGDRDTEAHALNNIGTVYDLLGNHAQVLEYYEESLVIKRESGDRAGEAQSLNNLGIFNQSIGNYAQALDYYEQSLIITREISDRAGEVQSLHNIGTVNRLLGNHLKALAYYEQSLIIAREIGDRATEALSLSESGFAYFGLNRFVEAENAFYHSISIRESLRAGELSDADKISLFETQTNAYKGLEQVLVLQNKPSEALEVTERGRARAFVELLANRLSLQQAQQLSPEPPDFATIQQIAAEQQSVLVEYSLINIGPDSPSIYIWVVQPTGEMHFRKVSLEDNSLDLANLVRQSRESIGVRGRGGGFELVEGSDSDTQLRVLHQHLIEPIADLLPAAPERRIVFIPQGDLFLVPFPALMDGDGTYLIEHHTVLTAPSIQTLALTRQQRTALSNTDTVPMLAIGNPTMPQVWNPRVSGYEQLSNLPGAEFEAREIAAFFNTQPLLNAAATEQAIKQQIESTRIVHFATHGLLEYGSPEDSGVSDLPGAIALAPGRGEDGLLTAAEIRILDLQAELVILSACDTGLGNITGDGVIGLSRSFIEAGTPSVIVSLWSVPDAPTATLMTEFYRQLQQGHSKAQALRQAMLVTMESHPNLIDWAAFTLIGEAN